MKLFIFLIISIIIKLIKSQNCNSGTLNTGGTFDNSGDCLGQDNENIHNICNNYCVANGWEFIAGKGEGCWGDPDNGGKVTAFCVCEMSCQVCPPFGKVCQTQCGSPLVDVKKYSTQQDCLGPNNENLHAVCTKYCNSEGNGWQFIPGYGEGCEIDDGDYGAFCKCHIGCDNEGTCPDKVGDACPVNFPICPQDGHAVNVAAWLGIPTSSSCAAHCAFSDFFFSEGCASQGCYIAGDSHLGPCVMNQGSSDYYCHCGEISYK